MTNPTVLVPVYVFIRANKADPARPYVFAWRDDVSGSIEAAVKAARVSMPESYFIGRTTSNNFQPIKG